MSLNRRAAIVGSIATVGALAAPIAIATRSKGDELQAFLDTASPDDLIQYHASQLASALCKARPGLWRFNVRTATAPDFAGHVLFYRYESETFNGYVQDYI